jgi:hypothetical protein
MLSPIIVQVLVGRCRGLCASAGRQHAKHQYRNNQTYHKAFSSRHERVWGNVPVAIFGRISAHRLGSGFLQPQLYTVAPRGHLYFGTGELSEMDCFHSSDAPCRWSDSPGSCREYLIRTLGEPKLDKTSPYDHASQRKKGIVAFSVNWANATGHIASWNGATYREPDHDNHATYIDPTNQR